VSDTVYGHDPSCFESGLETAHEHEAGVASLDPEDWLKPGQELLGVRYPLLAEEDPDGITPPAPVSVESGFDKYAK